MGFHCGFHSLREDATPVPNLRSSYLPTYAKALIGCGLNESRALKSDLIVILAGDGDRFKGNIELAASGVVARRESHHWGSFRIGPPWTEYYCQEQYDYEEFMDVQLYIFFFDRCLANFACPWRDSKHIPSHAPS